MTTILVKKSYSQGRCHRDRPVVQTVARTLSDNRVVTTSGDIWYAKPHKGKEADLVAIR